MRVSAVKDDLGYTLEYRHFAVYLDGELQPYCITADSESNEILRYKTGSNGRIRTVNGEAQTEAIYGEVEIVNKLQQVKYG